MKEMVNDTYELTIPQRAQVYDYYIALKEFFDITGAKRDRSYSSRTQKARAKLLKLSSSQFFELSTDVHDELQRRINESQDQPEYLLPKANFHIKRNQARQKLANLSQSRFNDLVNDILFEICRRSYDVEPVMEKQDIQLHDSIETNRESGIDELLIGKVAPNTSIQTTQVIPKKASIDWSSEEEDNEKKSEGIPILGSERNSQSVTSVKSPVIVERHSSDMNDSIFSPQSSNFNTYRNTILDIIPSDNTTISPSGSKHNTIISDLSVNNNRSIGRATLSSPIDIRTADKDIELEAKLLDFKDQNSMLLKKCKDYEEQISTLKEINETLNVKLLGVSNELSQFRNDSEHSNNMREPNMNVDAAKTFSETFQHDLVSLTNQLNTLSIENERLKQRNSELQLQLKSASSITENFSMLNLSKLDKKSISTFIKQDGLIQLSIVEGLSINATRLLNYINHVEVSADVLFEHIAHISDCTSRIISCIESSQYHEHALLLKASMSHAITSIRYYAKYHGILPKLTVVGAINEVLFGVCNIIGLAQINDQISFNSAQNSPITPQLSSNFAKLSDDQSTSKIELNNIALEAPQISHVFPNDSQLEDESPVKPLKITQRKAASTDSVTKQHSNRKPSGTGLFNSMINVTATPSPSLNKSISLSTETSVRNSGYSSHNTPTIPILNSSDRFSNTPEPSQSEKQNYADKSASQRLQFETNIPHANDSNVLADLNDNCNENHPIPSSRVGIFSGQAKISSYPDEINENTPEELLNEEDTPNKLGTKSDVTNISSDVVPDPPGIIEISNQPPKKSRGGIFASTVGIFSGRVGLFGNKSNVSSKTESPKKAKQVKNTTRLSPNEENVSNKPVTISTEVPHQISTHQRVSKDQTEENVEFSDSFPLDTNTPNNMMNKDFEISTNSNESSKLYIDKVDIPLQQMEPPKETVIKSFEPADVFDNIQDESFHKGGDLSESEIDDRTTNSSSKSFETCVNLQQKSINETEIGDGVMLMSTELVDRLPDNDTSVRQPEVSNETADKSEVSDVFEDSPEQLSDIIKTASRATSENTEKIDDVSVIHPKIPHRRLSRPLEPFSKQLEMTRQIMYDSTDTEDEASVKDVMHIGQPEVSENIINQSSELFEPSINTPELFSGQIGMARQIMYDSTDTAGDSSDRDDISIRQPEVPNGSINRLSELSELSTETPKLFSSQIIDDSTDTQDELSFRQPEVPEKSVESSELSEICTKTSELFANQSEVIHGVIDNTIGTSDQSSNHDEQYSRGVIDNSHLVFDKNPLPFLTAENSTTQAEIPTDITGKINMLNSNSIDMIESVSDKHERNIQQFDDSQSAVSDIESSPLETYDMPLDYTAKLSRHTLDANTNSNNSFNFGLSTVESDGSLKDTLLNQEDVIAHSSTLDDDLSKSCNQGLVSQRISFASNTHPFDLSPVSSVSMDNPSLHNHTNHILRNLQSSDSETDNDANDEDNKRSNVTSVTDDDIIYQTLKQGMKKRIELSPKGNQLHLGVVSGFSEANDTENEISDSVVSQVSPVKSLNLSLVETKEENKGVLNTLNSIEAKISNELIDEGSLSENANVINKSTELDEVHENVEKEEIEEEDIDFDIDSFDIENPDNTLSELLLYLEHQTMEVISTIQSLLTSIKLPKATTGDLRKESNAINQVIGQMVDATSVSMNQSRNASLKEHGSWVVQSLDDCRRRMTILCHLNKHGEISAQEDDGLFADKHFKQRLAGIAFDVAKCTKELVKTVEEASLKEEIEYLNSKLTT